VQLRLSFSEAGRLHQVFDQANQLPELPFDDLPGVLTTLATLPAFHQFQCRTHRRKGLAQLVYDGGKEPVLSAALIFGEPSGRTFPREDIISRQFG